MNSPLPAKKKNGLLEADGSNSDVVSDVLGFESLSSSKENKSQMAKKDYDKILVECCACCLSLDNPEKMEVDGERISVCPYCGSTDTKRLTIEDWNNRFERKYNLGPYLKLPKGMKWADIIGHENKETMEEEQIRREIRNAKKIHKK